MLGLNADCLPQNSLVTCTVQHAVLMCLYTHQAVLMTQCDCLEIVHDGTVCMMYNFMFIDKEFSYLYMV